MSKSLIVALFLKLFLRLPYLFLSLFVYNSSKNLVIDFSTTSNPISYPISGYEIGRVGAAFLGKFDSNPTWKDRVNVFRPNSGPLQLLNERWRNG